MSEAHGRTFHEKVRRELRARMAQRGIDAYMPQTGANLFYVTGFQSSWIDLTWRWMGLETALLPTDAEREPVLLVSDYSEADARAQTDLAQVRTFGIWVECRDPDVVMDGTRNAVLDRPEQYDPGDLLRIIAKIFADSGVSLGVIGTDLAVMRKETHDGLRAALPGCRFVDISDILYDMRKIKHPEEIRRLRNATTVFDAALSRSMQTVREGTRLADLRAGFDGAVVDVLRDDPDLGSYQGTFGFNSIGGGDIGNVRPGDIVKIDAGVRLDGYWSDCARVFSCGEPSALQAQIHDALLAGFEAAEARLRPGATMREVHGAALDTVRGAGLPNYSRGHFGHSIGLDDLIEEPPFIGPNDTVLETGMVLCLELPYYPPSTGCFNIEELFLITEDGAERFNAAPREMRELAK